MALRCPNISQADLYKYLVQEFGKLAAYYAKSYSEYTGQLYMKEDYQIEIVYEMMRAWESYQLKGKSLEDCRKIMKVVPIHFWHNKIKRKKNANVLNDINKCDLRQQDNTVLYDDLYEKGVDDMVDDPDSLEMLKAILYETDAVKNGGMLSRQALIRFFRSRSWCYTRIKRAFSSIQCSRLAEAV